LKVFSEIANSKVFQDASVFLFFTKADKFKVNLIKISGITLSSYKFDILQEKIKRKPINFAFPEYKGSPDLEHSLEFITKTFQDEKKEGRLKFIILGC